MLNSYIKMNKCQPALTEDAKISSNIAYSLTIKTICLEVGRVSEEKKSKVKQEKDKEENEGLNNDFSSFCLDVQNPPKREEL